MQFSDFCSYCILPFAFKLFVIRNHFFCISHVSFVISTQFFYYFFFLARLVSIQSNRLIYRGVCWGLQKLDRGLYYWNIGTRVQLVQHIERHAFLRNYCWHCGDFSFFINSFLFCKEKCKLKCQIKYFYGLFNFKINYIVWFLCNQICLQLNCSCMKDWWIIMNQMGK